MSLADMSTFVGPVFAMAAPASGASLLPQFITFAIIIAIFYFVLLMPARKKQQKVQDFLAGLKEGDRVITTGGIYGQLTKVGENSVQLQIAERLRIEVARASIGGYQGQPPVVETNS
jgi:preprotein translocase subunit YajC